MSINEKKSAPISPKLLGTLVVILAVIALVIAIFQIGISIGKVKQAQVQVNENTNNSNTTTEFPLPPEEDEIFSRTGIVTDINDNILSISATIRNGDAFEKTTIKVITADSTKFFALKISPIPDKATDEERLTEISLKDIAIGHAITATAETNIKNELEFSVIEVRRVDRI